MGPLRYLAVLLVVAVLGGAVTYAARWIAAVATCPSSPGSDAFVAYCNHPQFGDYEHGAYLLGLEPEAVAALQRAQVLILGNSRTQFAFSTGAATEFFGAKRIGYYVLGFGYSEGAAFAVEVLDRLRLAPRMLVVNTDTFFTGTMSPPAQSVTGGGWPARLEYEAKRNVLRWQSAICASVEIVCTAASKSILRRIGDGHWLWEGTFAPDASRPIDEAKRIPRFPKPLYRAQAAAFLDRLAVRRDCVVLTSTPNGNDNWTLVAQDLAAQLRLPLALPQLDGLTTVDGSHLNRISAERWSAAVLAEIEPLIDRCLS